MSEWAGWGLAWRSLATHCVLTGQAGLSRLAWRGADMERKREGGRERQRGREGEREREGEGDRDRGRDSQSSCSS